MPSGSPFYSPFGLGEFGKAATASSGSSVALVKAQSGHSPKIRSRCGIPFPVKIIGVFFRLAWLNIEGTGLDEFYSIYQGHLFCQKDTYGENA